MITGFFLNILYSFIVFFINLLPVVGLPSDWATAFVLVWSYLMSFSFLFPVSTLITVLGYAFGFHLILLSYDLSLKVYHLIRG